MNRKRLLLLIIIFVVFHPLTFSQSTRIYDEMKAAYPAEDAVFLNQKQHIDISFREDDFFINSSFHSKMMVLSDKGGMYAEESIGFSSFREITSIDAKTLIPSNNKYKELAVKEISETDRMSGGVFYDDYKQKSFVFPGVTEGAITELNYEENIKEPRFLGAFYFNSYVPVLESEYSVSFPANVKLKYKLLGENTSSIKFLQTEKDGISTYTWKALNSPKMEFEDKAPSLNHYEPHIIIYIDEVEVDGKQRKILSDVSSLYNWYHELTENINSNRSVLLEEKVREITSEEQTREEKARAIFYWVMDNIKYVAFEDGLGGFIPREAEDVCEKKYGDCKDMASLITEMLEVAGIQANLTWIGTRDIPYSYEDVPTPMVDNHMISSLEMDGKRLFLDATGTYLKFGYPTSMIQGKQALVGKGKGAFELVTVPEMPKEANLIEELSELRIRDGELVGRGQTVYEGYPRFNTVRRIENTPEANMDKLMKSLLQRGNNKFNVLDFNIDGLDNRELPLSINYEMVIPDHVRSLDGELYINLNLNKKFNNDQIDLAKRKLDIEYDYKNIRKNTVRVEVPKEYKIEYLPEDVKFEHPLFGFEMSYTSEEGFVKLVSNIWIDCLVLKREDFKAWNQMISALNEAYQELVVLSLK